MTAFTPVSRTFLERTDLSVEARLIATYLDTFTSNWTVREAHITKALGIGRRPYQRAVRELKAAGLMRDGGRMASGKVRPPRFIGGPRVRSLAPQAHPEAKRETSPNTQKRVTSMLGSKTHLADGPDLLPKAIDIKSPSGSLSRAAGTSRTKAPALACPLGCGALIPPDGDVQWAESHIKAFHSAAQRTQGKSGTLGSRPLTTTIPKPETRPRLTTGPSGKRWYECEECGGQFEYLRRGGTCRECEAKISG